MFTVVERVELYKHVKIEGCKGIGSVCFRILKFTMNVQTCIGNPRVLPLLQPYATTSFCCSVLWRVVVVSCCVVLYKAVPLQVWTGP
jgi:hypothetical protein